MPTDENDFGEIKNSFTDTLFIRFRFYLIGPYNTGPRSVSLTVLNGAGVKINTT